MKILKKSSVYMYYITEYVSMNPACQHVSKTRNGGPFHSWICHTARKNIFGFITGLEVCKVTKGETRKPCKLIVSTKSKEV